MSRRNSDEFDTRDAPKFVVRFRRHGMPEEVAERARLEARSMNDIWMVAMEEYLHGKRRKHLLLDALERRATELGITLKDLM
jgi:hypothetical protein